MPDTVAVVEHLPKCSFCDKTASYDFKTNITGQWAYGCYDHWRVYRMFDTLGVGKGQMLQLQKPTNR